MGSNELRNKPENTTLLGTEWLYTQEATSPYEVQKMKFQTILDRIDALSFQEVGSSIMYMRKYKDISASFPWLCLSKPTAVLTTSNYTQDFIDSQREIKWIYEEAGATPVSSFGGAWVTNEFTLDNNATNIAFLAELLEDWEFHDKPTSGWRILFDGTTELDITNIVLSTRKITTAANGSGTSIEIYTNRVKGSTTSCKHFTEAGLADYQAGGGKIAGALRRDKMQLIEGAFGQNFTGINQYDSTATTGAFSLKDVGTRNVVGASAATISGAREILFKSSSSTNARTSATTDGETQAKSATVFKYLFCGSYST
jgi:hypothetical protein